MSLLTSKGDYQFANTLNRNLHDMTEAINKLADAAEKQADTKTPDKPLKYEIPVRGGSLIIEECIDPDNPGVWVSYRPEGCQADIDLVLVENTDTELRKENNADEKDLRVLVWNDPRQEDYTNEHIFSGKEAAEAVQEAEA